MRVRRPGIHRRVSWSEAPEDITGLCAPTSPVLAVHGSHDNAFRFALLGSILVAGDGVAVNGDDGPPDTGVLDFLAGRPIPHRLACLVIMCFYFFNFFHFSAAQPP
jgi:hypothetical protein